MALYFVMPLVHVAQYSPMQSGSSSPMFQAEGHFLTLSASAEIELGTFCVQILYLTTQLQLLPMRNDMKVN